MFKVLCLMVLSGIISSTSFADEAKFKSVTYSCSTTKGMSMKVGGQAVTASNFKITLNATDKDLSLNIGDGMFVTSPTGYKVSEFSVGSAPVYVHFYSTQTSINVGIDELVSNEAFITQAVDYLRVDLAYDAGFSNFSYPANYVGTVRGTIVKMDDYGSILLGTPGDGPKAGCSITFQKEKN